MISVSLLSNFKFDLSPTVFILMYSHVFSYILMYSGPLEFIATSPGCCSGGECEGHVGGSVCFSCAAKNFCSVDWLKDDQLSYLCNSTDGHYYCLDEDTTLYINSLFPKAKGNYTCELSNSTHTISREFILGMICGKYCVLDLPDIFRR